MLAVVVVLAFVVGVGMVLGGFSAVEKLPQFLMQRRLGARLQEVSQPQEPTEDTSKKLLVKVQHEGPPEQRSLAMQSLLREEAQSAFREWRTKPDKIRY